MSMELQKQIEEFLSVNKQAMVDDIIDLINIKSVSIEGPGKYPFGEGTSKALDRFLEIGDRMGFATKNYDYYCGAIKYCDFDKEIGIFGHMDVVPEGNDWIYEPYNAVVENGYIIGRGSSDDKGPTIAGLYAVKFLKDYNIPLKYGVQVVAGCNEENGMNDIEKFLESEKVPVFSFTPDAMFPVCNGEKGMMRAKLVFPKLSDNVKNFFGGIVSNMVADRATIVLANKTVADVGDLGEKFIVVAADGGVSITACGIAAHAAHPEGSNNAIKLVSKLVCDKGLVCDDDKKYFQHIVDILSDHNGIGIGKEISDEVSGKITHISGIIEMIDGIINMDMNVRYPVTADGENVVKDIDKYLASKDLKLDIYSHALPCYIPADRPEIQALIKAYQDVSGDTTTTTTYTMGGGTYSKVVPNCVAYGPKFPNETSPFPAGRGEEHMADECANVDNLVESVKVYIKAILSLNNLEL